MQCGFKRNKAVKFRGSRHRKSGRKSIVCRFRKMWVQQVCEKDVAAGRRGLMRRRILNGWANKKDSHERNKLPSVTS